MHLDIGNIPYSDQMFFYRFCYLAGVDYVRRNLHGKKAVRIAAERFPVEKIPPYTYYLRNKKSHTGSICHSLKRNLSDPAVQSSQKSSSQYPAVQRHAAVSDIADFGGAPSAEKIPVEQNIKSSGSDNPSQHGGDHHFQIEILVFILRLCLTQYKDQPQKHSCRNKQSIYRDLKAEDGN